MRQFLNIETQEVFVAHEETMWTVNDMRNGYNESIKNEYDRNLQSKHPGNQ